MNQIEEIYNFSCPLWKDLPESGLMSKEVVSYINEILSPLFLGEEVITQTMIQNYSKWKVLPKISGRKYFREQISILIIISVYKNIIDIAGLKSGVELQLKLVSIEEGYNDFATCLNRAVERTFKSSKQKRRVEIDNFEISQGLEGMELIANAFSYKLLARLIIEKNGYKNLLKEIN